MEKIQATLDTLVASNANLTSKLDKFDSLSKKMDNLNASVTSIGARLDLNEANLLEQSNKLEEQELVIKALDDKLEEENDIEIAHRIGPLVKNVARPRTVIFKLHHLQNKLSIVERARSIVLAPTDLPGVRLRISEDISVRRRKLRDQ
ncbi:unnamed protein product [Arctogadus glacialis]